MATLQTVNNIELRLIEDNEHKTNQRKLRGNRGFIVSAAVKYLLLKTKHSLGIRDCVYQTKQTNRNLVCEIKVCKSNRNFWNEML